VAGEGGRDGGAQGVGRRVRRRRTVEKGR